MTKPGVGRAGGCLCGHIRFETLGDPKLVAACHCRSCRRHTGAPFAVYADFNLEQVRFVGDAPQLFESSPGAWRGFCPRCGSTLSFQGDNTPDEIHLHVGSFDDPSLFLPAEEDHIETRLHWVRISQGS